MCSWLLNSSGKYKPNLVVGTRDLSRPCIKDIKVEIQIPKRQEETNDKKTLYQIKSKKHYVINRVRNQFEKYLTKT